MDIPDINVWLALVDQNHLHHFADYTTQAAFPHRLWTDAYLAAFAIASGCRLVSFDADFARFPGLNFLHLTP